MSICRITEKAGRIFKVALCLPYAELLYGRNHIVQVGWRRRGGMARVGLGQN